MQSSVLLICYKHTWKLQHEITSNRMMNKIQRVVKMPKRQSQPKARISSDRYLYSKDVELSRFQVFFVPETVLVNYQDFYTLLWTLDSCFLKQVKDLDYILQITRLQHAGTIKSQIYFHGYIFG